VIQRNNKKAWIFIVAVLFSTGTAYSQQRKPCQGLYGNMRTACLKREVARTTAEANRANQELERANLAMVRACQRVAILDQTADLASIAGEVSNRKPLLFAGMYWTSIRAIMSALTNERRNCEAARRAMADNRRRF